MHGRVMWSCNLLHTYLLCKFLPVTCPCHAGVHDASNRCHCRSVASLDMRLWERRTRNAVCCLLKTCSRHSKRHAPSKSCPPLTPWVLIL